MKEIVVIGGGIIGCFLAHDLSKQEGVHVSLIEKHQDIAEEVTAANSAIVHAGYDPEDGTLKALLNKRGADLYPEVCRELQIDYNRCGALILACGEEEEATLQELYERGLRRDVKVKLLDREEILKREPNVSENVTKAMEAEDTAIITPWEVCYALMDEVLLNGGTLYLGETVTAIHKGEGYTVVTDKGTHQADLVINAAGLGAQRIMELVEDEKLFEITPKRGQYYILSKRAQGFVHEVLYPVPTKVGKGVLALPTCHGNTLLGPNSEVLQEEDTSTTADGLAEVKVKLAKTVQNVPYQEVIHSYSGLRPCGNQNDFYIEESQKNAGFIHCGCIDSPGLASAPAISEYVLKEFIAPHITLTEKKEYVHRSASCNMKQLDLEEKQEQIQKEPGFGHIICRCEEISEQEVVDCIHRPCGARSIKGVKKRVRPGMGKCQGGFCEVEVAKILARELNIPLNEVRYDSDSYFMVNKGVK